MPLLSFGLLLSSSLVVTEESTQNNGWDDWGRNGRGECRFESVVTWLKLELSVCAQVNGNTSCSCITYWVDECERGLSGLGMLSTFQKSMQAGN